MVLVIMVTGSNENVSTPDDNSSPDSSTSIIYSNNSTVIDEFGNKSIIALAENGDIVKLSGTYNNRTQKWDVKQEILTDSGFTFYCDECGDDPESETLTPVGPTDEFPYDEEESIPEDWVDYLPTNTGDFETDNPTTWEPWTSPYDSGYGTGTSTGIGTSISPLPGTKTAIPGSSGTGTGQVNRPPGTQAGTGTSSVGGGGPVSGDWNVYCGWDGVSGRGCCEVRKHNDYFMSASMMDAQFTQGTTFANAMAYLMNLFSQDIGNDCEYGLFHGPRQFRL